MVTSVRTKPAKKQGSTKDGTVFSGGETLENALSALENACFTILNVPFSSGRRDSQVMYWQQRFINIANPVSLALMEYKGPRHFHYHYRHREHDASILHPVLENPIEMMAMVCKDALTQCRSDLVGLEDPVMISAREEMEAALVAFLKCYKKAEDNS